MVGLGLVIIGLLVIDLLVPHLSGSIGLKLAPALLVAGFGGGMVISPNVTLSLAEVDPARAGSGGGMLQTAQRVGSAIGVAVVLAQFFDQLMATRGDYSLSLSVGLRTVIGLIGVALLFGLVDLVRRQSGNRHPAPRHAVEEAAPKHAA